MPAAKTALALVELCVRPMPALAFVEPPVNAMECGANGAVSAAPGVLMAMALTNGAVGPASSGS